jgi:hypothetical protein
MMSHTDKGIDELFFLQNYIVIEPVTI